MKTCVLLRFEHRNYVTIISNYYEQQASSCVKFDNDFDVIFMFKM